MIRHVNRLNIVTDRCPKIYKNRDSLNGFTQMVFLDDCEDCQHCGEIDYEKGLIACGPKAKITFTLLDFSPRIPAKIPLEDKYHLNKAPVVVQPELISVPMPSGAVGVPYS